MLAKTDVGRVRKQRGKGEGSIRQRTDGRWEARITTPDGKRRSLFAKTRADVQRKLASAQHDIQSGLPLPEGRTTLAGFLSQWLETVAQPRVRPSTFIRYSLDVRHIAASPLGRLRLARLTPLDVQHYLNDLTAQGLSPATVAHRRAVLRSALTSAENWGMIARNPAAGKRVTIARAKRHEVEALSPEQARDILAAFAGHPLEALVTLALATGLRQGELLGLRWGDISFDAGMLTVRFQLQPRGGKAWDLVEPKSSTARRSVPVAPEVLTVLHAHRVRQKAQRLKAGKEWQEPLPDLVFTSERGTPMDKHNVTHRFQRRLTDAGLPRMRFHDLRHGLATLMLANGADLMTIKETLGHSQISLTANTYTHVLPALKRDAMDRVAAHILGAV